MVMGVFNQRWAEMTRDENLSGGQRRWWLSRANKPKESKDLLYYDIVDI